MYIYFFAATGPNNNADGTIERETRVTSHNEYNLLADELRERIAKDNNCKPKEISIIALNLL